MLWGCRSCWHETLALHPHRKGRPPGVVCLCLRAATCLQPGLGTYTVQVKQRHLQQLRSHLFPCLSCLQALSCSSASPGMGLPVQSVTAFMTASCYISCCPIAIMQAGTCSQQPPALEPLCSMHLNSSLSRFQMPRHCAAANCRPWPSKPPGPNEQTLQIATQADSPQIILGGCDQAWAGHVASCQLQGRVQDGVAIRVQQHHTHCSNLPSLHLQHPNNFSRHC